MGTEKRLAERLKKINPSSTLAITSKAKKLKSEGRDVVALGAGEPDFDTPDAVKDAGIEAIRSGFTKYTPTTGISDLKKAISRKFKEDNKLDYAPGQIIVSCGAKHSIFNTLMVLVGKGDEVLIPSPFWVSYPEMVNLCEGKASFIETSSANSFKMTAGQLKKSITARTKVLILNSPSNPTGCVYSEDELRAIADICVKHSIFVISDEIYEKIIFDGLKHISIASFGKDIYDLTVTVNGMSKSFSMTGWRIGYLGAAQYIADAISNLQDHSTSNPSSISQKAALAALGLGNNFSEQMRLEFEKKRNYTVERLKNIKKLGYVEPKGAFYIFCDISETGLDSFIFSSRLLDEGNVAIIPGSSFGRDDYVRISFATSMEQLKEGFDRIESWVKGL